ncbi:hypothetical protein M885DRAFT_610149 [Pelagophyceae sp. CCMP2097]|nr:hypothetical protein M885DRAFT_610149 [Pelagophyceae sp. CCMP2097]
MLARLRMARGPRLLQLAKQRFVCGPVACIARTFASSKKPPPAPGARAVDALGAGDAVGELARLAAELRRHDALYYTSEAPEVDDATYDALAAREAAIEARFPALARADSRSRRVGPAAVDEAAGASGVRWAHAPARHLAPMLSLDNATSGEDVERFVVRVAKFAADAGAAAPLRFFCEPKVDGLSLALRYDGGLLVSAATRGDGRVGENVAQNVRGGAVHGVPDALAAGGSPALFEVRGEVYLSAEDLDRANSRRRTAGDAPYVNARNAASGVLRRKESDSELHGLLNFVAYDAVEGGDAPDGLPQSHHSLRSALKAWGFDVLEPSALVEAAAGDASAAGAGVDVGVVDALVAFHASVVAERSTIPFETDGVVYKVDNRAVARAAGASARAPRCAVAHKFTSATGETTLLAVRTSVGRMGAITPVAILEPVSVGGVTISRASLYNYAMLDALDARPGDRVLVARAGDVIPKIVAVVPAAARALRIEAPLKCPACGGPTARAVDGPILRCAAGRGCAKQAVSAVVSFASRDRLDVKGLGPARVADLVDAGRVTSLESLLRLPEVERALEVAAKGDAAATAASAKRLAVLAQAAKACGDEEDSPDAAEVSALRALLPLSLWPGAGDVSSRSLVRAIELKRAGPVPLWRVVAALGVDQFGRTTSKVLAAHHANDGAALANALRRSVAEEAARAATADAARPAQQDWAKATAGDVRAELKRRGLSVRGLKAELVARLAAAADEAARPAAATPVAPRDWTKASVAELRAELGRLGHGSTGRKADLLARLAEAATAPLPEASPSPLATYRDELLRIHGIGDAAVDALLRWASLPANLATVDALVEIIHIDGNVDGLDAPAAAAEGGAAAAFAGQTVVFTGSTEGLARVEMEALAEGLGGKVTKAISSKTSLVVYGESASAAKLKKAQVLGVRIVPVAEWVAQARAAR